jgi:peptidoglycan/LPS O-acetylase OafA/YrhL
MLEALSSSSSYGFPEACAVVVILACLSPGHVALAVLLAALPLLVLGLGVGRPIALRFWELPALLYLGEVSYSLYMTHTLALKLINHLLPSAAYVTSGLGTRLAVLVAYTLLIVLGCWASYRFVEAPARRASRRLLRPRLYRADGLELSPVGQI